MKKLVLILSVLTGLFAADRMVWAQTCNPALIAATAVVGLIAYPWLQPAWVMVK